MSDPLGLIVIFLLIVGLCALGGGVRIVRTGGEQRFLDETTVRAALQAARDARTDDVIDGIALNLMDRPLPPVEDEADAAPASTSNTSSLCSRCELDQMRVPTSAKYRVTYTDPRDQLKCCSRQVCALHYRMYVARNWWLSGTLLDDTPIDRDGRPLKRAAADVAQGVYEDEVAYNGMERV